MVEAQISLAVPALTPLALAAQHKDVMAELLADQRSPNTRRAYAKDLKDFFRFAAGVADPSPELVGEFLGLDRFNAVALVLKYKAHLLGERGLKEATVNRRLAALKALVNFARQVGKCNYTLSDVKSEKVVPYRDTTGIGKEAYRKMLAVPDRGTLKGQRDYAILRLLWENALRRSELVRADIRDLDLEGRSLLILGKGKGTQKEAVSLSGVTVQALQAWLLSRRELDVNRPLFIALDRASYGHRLTGTAVYKLVESAARAAGINKKISPHRIRHSGITAALDATGGDVRSVQKLSRHASLNTLMIYDDNRQNVQGEISALLADLV
ncbi:tyrosine-type recombinase/integrase [Lusitaniella coriacea]|uniref:tyrosine-type recombinase/integrase n=1 Tax=Lusitaniella coriacea TaxID=1983105 RepID=UPI003CE886AF